MAREFEYSDEIVPSNGLLAGSGGGFMQSYVDVHAGQGGDLALLQYYLPGYGQRTPDSINALMLGRPLLLEGPQASEIAAFKKRLIDAGFLSMDNTPVSSESVSYLVLTNEDGTLHSLEWSLGETPYSAEIHNVFAEVVEFGITALRSLIR